METKPEIYDTVTMAHVKRCCKPLAVPGMHLGICEQKVLLMLAFFKVFKCGVMGVNKVGKVYTTNKISWYKSTSGSHQSLSLNVFSHLTFFGSVGTDWCFCLFGLVHYYCWVSVCLQADSGVV